MAGCNSKKMAYGGKVKKMKEGGMSKKDKELFGETEMDQKPPKGFKKSGDKKTSDNKKGFSKLPEKVQQKIDPEMAKKYNYGGKVKKMKNGGKVKSHRGDGCAMRGKTKGRMV